MMLVHVIAAGHEFVGEVGEHWEERDVIKLRKAVRLLFINSPKGPGIILRNLCDDNNYDGDVHVSARNGVIIVMPIQELGNLAKEYRQARSNIVLNEKKINIAGVQH